MLQHSDALRHRGAETPRPRCEIENEHQVEPSRATEATMATEAASSSNEASEPTKANLATKASKATEAQLPSNFRTDPGVSQAVLGQAKARARPCPL